MSYIWGKRSYQRMEGVNPYLVECAEMTICESKYDLTIPYRGGVRTANQQNGLFKDNTSKCDGFEILSYHQIEAGDNGYGNALDIIPTGEDPYQQTRKLNYIGRLMLLNWQELIFKYAQEDIDIGVMIWGGTFGASSWGPPALRNKTPKIIYFHISNYFKIFLAYY